MLPVAFPSSSLRTSQPTRVLAVIPVRFASTRLPGKALAEIAGRPMIEHVYRRAAATPGIDAVVVATDDQRIADVVARFEGHVRMTAPSHPTGTDRVAELVRDLACEVVVHVQGDEPLVEPAMLAQLIDPLVNDAEVQMTTLRRALTERADYTNPNVVKVVVDARQDALYFSRSPIPFVRGLASGGGPGVRARASAGESDGAAAAFTPAVFRHIGLYAYRREFLLSLAALPRTPLEEAESLEQLRALEHGFRIRTIETTYDSVGVDTPEDLERVRRRLEHLAVAPRT